MPLRRPEVRTISSKGSSAPSLAICERKFESVTPTSRMPFGGGKTDRGNNINQIAHALNSGLDPLLVLAEAMDELRGALTAIRRAAGYDRR